MSRYIDANKLMQDIDERGTDFWCSSVDICNAKKIVSEQPTADVQEVKHGEWGEMEHIICDGIPHLFRVCTVCDTEYYDVFMAACCADFEGLNAIFHYCPHCGAIMDGKENEE